MPRSLLMVGAAERFTRLRRGFMGEGYKVDVACSLDNALHLAAMSAYNAVIIMASSAELLIACVQALVLLMPDGAVPLLAISDLPTDDEIRTLTSGLSCCIESTATFAAVLACLRSLLQIVEGFPQHFRICDLGIDPIRRKASRAGVPLQLCPIDFDALLYLAERADQLVTHGDLHRRLWPSQAFSKNRIAVQMHKVRRAIRDGRQAPLLHTVRDCGYLLSQYRPEKLFQQI